MSNSKAVNLLGLLLLGGNVSVAGPHDRWAMEADLGGTAALASPAVKKEGQTGSAVGLSVRMNGNDNWDMGVGYNQFSLENGIRLRSATFFGDRFFSPSGKWTPYLRLGAGLSTENAGGSFNRLGLRAGGGVKRSIHPRWEMGFKTELWFSPTSAATEQDMLLVTAGLTLARSAPVARKNQTVALALTEEKPFALKPIRIRFRKESWELSKSNVQAKTKSLTKAADYLRTHPTAQVELHGYADSRRPMGYDIVLSRKRAEALRDRLVARWNIPRSRIAVFAHGSDQRNLPKKCVVVYVVQNRLP